MEKSRGEEFEYEIFERLVEKLVDNVSHHKSNGFFYNQGKEGDVAGFKKSFFRQYLNGYSGKEVIITSSTLPISVFNDEQNLLYLTKFLYQGGSVKAYYGPWIEVDKNGNNGLLSLAEKPNLQIYQLPKRLDLEAIFLGGKYCYLEQIGIEIEATKYASVVRNFRNGLDFVKGKLENICSSYGALEIKTPSDKGIWKRTYDEILSFWHKVLVDDKKGQRLSGIVKKLACLCIATEAIKRYERQKENAAVSTPSI